MNKAGLTPLIASLLFSITYNIFAQVPNGPGGVENTSGTSNLRTWWRADAGITLTGTQVSTWADQSGYGNTLTGPAGFRTFTTVSAGLNNQPVMRYSGAQYFTSTITGPNVNNITLFLVGNGTSYQSLFRFQNQAGVFCVYPWEFGGGRTFISSSDGGTGSGIASGLVTSANNVGAARYRRNTTNGMQTYLNGGINAQRNSVNVVLPSEPLFSGRYNPGASEYPNCDIGELITFYAALNDAQMVIVQNYLAAKYNVTLSSNDVYTMDNSGNGNFDYDVAGIGRVDASNIHSDAQGTGIVRILNPVGLGDGEYYMWGHSNGTLGSWGTTDYPAGQGLQGRLVRTWRGSETGAITSFDVRFDLTGLGPVTVSDLRLLVDVNNNGLFADETVGGGGVISGATSIGGNVYQFTGVTAMNDNIRFTLGTINLTQTPLPIELTEFSAVADQNKIDISWKTASEKNSAFFELERSSDALTFEKLAKIDSKAPGGNSQSPLNYSFTDASPLGGISYYRLKQNDMDNTYTYSNIISVSNRISKDLSFVIYPNPNKGEFTLDVSGIENDHEINLSLKNEKGENVFQSAFHLQDHSGKFQIIPENKLASGLYFCTLTLEGIPYTVKVVVS